ncbi:hypothetical protein BGW36DRAFT_389184 [Talaromyces proteolyticus]|uniref:Fe2OG dioxygenase domain-containing protein n=1 Tax=Talaromyces proteolyticus TaxID=1131652 RepID=A0AAD4KEY4_9EURO|nr:uncharacterized protein BGW36DRAFT_389184 [Talaromyces proteolyticus]KAH8690689.1 hypothetical protein BGW36DRAFT_389184 [Talaromyces proteolyticus]
MPTDQYFSKLPAFPSDVPIAKLNRLSYAKLLTGDEVESEALFEASRTLGFFLLDFSTCVEGQNFLQRAERMFEINEDVNNLEQDELMKYAYRPPHHLFGYKHLGNLKIEDGRPDRVEFYNVGQDDMTGVSATLPNPPLIEENRSDIKAYMQQAHVVTDLICDILDSQLRLPKGTLSSLQPQGRPSGTSLRMLRYPPQPEGDRRTSLLGHTDLGSLTILFNTIGGLQILPAGADAKDDDSWVYVQPQPNCAIVNLGDAMVEWSAGILRSNLHRVTFAPGDQSKSIRYSLAYLVRPFGDAPMKRLAGGDSIIPPLEEGEEDTTMTAREWESHRAVAIKAGKDNARSRGGRDIKVPAKKAAATGLLQAVN